VIKGKISFVDVLFYGNEWNLISFELLLFLLIDLAAHNFVLAAIITYIAARIISFVREVTGRKNLGKKALIDNRFLI
jgi:meckelin